MRTRATRTRVKICGISAPADGVAAAEAGADAIGLVFFPPSPRNVSVERAREIAMALPPFVAKVALFVNPERAVVDDVLARVPIDCLQFHGDETPAFCRGFGVPFLKAVRVRPGLDLIEYLSDFSDASGWLLDAYREDKWGGTGTTFDWGAIPAATARPVVLSGGLDPDNVADGVRTVRPWAVDVSSGVERGKGIKDHDRIRRFVEAVREADQCR